MRTIVALCWIPFLSGGTIFETGGGRRYNQDILNTSVFFYFSFNRGSKLAGKLISIPGGGGDRMDLLDVSVLVDLSYIPYIQSGLTLLHKDFPVIYTFLWLHTLL